MHQVPAAFERNHNHDQCVRSALDAAIAHCRREGVRLTPLRRRVLQVIWRSHIPLGAYEICGALGEQGDRVLPPTVYRVLEFLEKNGLVHRIATRNAFIGCNQPDTHHHGRYLICSACGTVAELPADGHVDGLIGEAGRLKFTARSVRVEAVGLCASCAPSGGDAS